MQSVKGKGSDGSFMKKGHIGENCCRITSSVVVIVELDSSSSKDAVVDASADVCATVTFRLFCETSELMVESSAKVVDAVIVVVCVVAAMLVRATVVSTVVVSREVVVLAVDPVVEVVSFAASEKLPSMPSPRLVRTCFHCSRMQCSSAEVICSE